MNLVSDHESNYLLKEYSKIDFNKKSIQMFLEAIYNVIINNIPFTMETSLLDIGCGRGYFLEYLKDIGFRQLAGIDPCLSLLDNRIYADIKFGSFEVNSFEDNSFDIVFTCHTLHHLEGKDPSYAIQEMVRISKKYIVIVEINNTNLPMLGISLLNHKDEKNAFMYNKKKVEKHAKELNLEIIYSENIKSCYMSGINIFYRILSRIGTMPYNILIAKKTLKDLIYQC